MSDELEKIALTRYQKEIAKGNISSEDVGLLPKSHYASPDDAKEHLSMTRRGMRAPAEVGDAQLARKRRLADKLYEAQSANPEKGVQVKKKFFPGLGPATIPGRGKKQIKVLSPPEAGQFMRMFIEGDTKDEQAAMRGTIRPKIYKGLGSKPVDSTLTHATLGHELAEAKHFKTKKLAPFASHAGVKPILREKQLLRGDPAAIRIMNFGRQLSSEDALVDKLVTQAGGTADSPLPTGGKHERALNRMLKRRTSELSPNTRGKALGGLLRGNEVSYMPEEITSGVRSAKSQAKGVLREAGRAVKPGGGGSLKSIRDAGRPLWDTARHIKRFLKGG